MEKNKSPKKIIKDLLPMTIAELLVMLLIILGAFILSLCEVVKFEVQIALGAFLGALIAVLNYCLLIVSVDRAVNNYLALRGEREMSEEEAERFAAENSMPIQNAIKTSFIIRTGSMLVLLVIAFITKWFNPLATAIPLLAFRPLLSVIELIKGKVAK